MINNSLKKMYPDNKILLKYFSNRDNWRKLDNLYNNRLSSRSSLIQFELDLLENEIQILLSKEKFTEEENNIINNIRSYYSSNLIVNQLLIVSSPIYNDPKCLNMLFNDNNKNFIHEKKKYYIERIDNYIKRYINEDKLSDKELQLMFSYLSSDYIDIKDRNIRIKIDDIIKMMFKKDKVNHYDEVKFLLDYVHRKQCNDFGYERCKFYLDFTIPTIDDKGDVKTTDFPSPLTNAGVRTGGIIVVNTRHMDREKLNNVEMYGLNLFSYIQSVSHESWHHKQLDDFLNERYTIENLAEIIHCLLYSNMEFYRTNYFFVPIEYQANDRGYQEEMIYAKRLKYDKNVSYANDRMKNLFIEQSYGMAIPNIKDEKSLPMILDNFIVNELADKCKKNPKYVKRYKILQLFFKNDGTLMNLEELIDSFYNIEVLEKDGNFDYECNYEKIFMPFLVNSLNNYNLESTKENNVLNSRIQRILKIVIKNEVNQLLLMIQGYDQFSIFEKNHLILLNKNFVGTQNKLIIERLERIRNFIKYIKDENEVKRIMASINPFLGKIDSIEKTGKTR